MAVAMPVAALDLDQGAVHRGRGRHAQPGGSGYGHCQQRKTNQGDTSHTVSSVRVIATSGTSSLWNVCSGAHEVNHKGVFEPPFPFIPGPDSPRDREPRRISPGSRGQASLWSLSGKFGSMRLAGRWQER
jgi:hypothetical protein